MRLNKNPTCWGPHSCSTLSFEHLLAKAPRSSLSFQPTNFPQPMGLSLPCTWLTRAPRARPPLVPRGFRPAAGPRALGYRSLSRARSLWLARHSSTGHAHRQRRGQVGFASSHSAAAGRREAAAGALAPGVGVARSFPDPSLLAHSDRSPRGSDEPRPASSSSRTGPA